MATLTVVIFAGLFVLVVFLVGATIGYLLGSKRLEATVKPVVEHILRLPNPTSGPVKAITPQEIRVEQDRGFVDKMQEIVGDDGS